jgi:hypothetical protein
MPIRHWQVNMRMLFAVTLRRLSASVVVSEEKIELRFMCSV